VRDKTDVKIWWWWSIRRCRSLPSINECCRMGSLVQLLSVG